MVHETIHSKFFVIFFLLRHRLSLLPQKEYTRKAEILCLPSSVYLMFC